MPARSGEYQSFPQVHCPNMEQTRTSSSGSPSSEDNMDMQSFGIHLPQLNQENNNKGLPQQSYFRGDNVNLHQFNALSLQQQGRYFVHPTLPAYAPTLVESFTQNVVDQPVHLDHGGNLINQHQLNSHAGNFSQASQGTLAITGLLPSYPAEGAFNPLWNSNTLQAITTEATILHEFQALSSNNRMEVELPEWVPLASNPQQAYANPYSQENQNQNSNIFYLQNQILRGPPITNAVYDPLYAIFGKPVDPHLRLFMELLEKDRNGGGH